MTHDPWDDEDPFSDPPSGRSSTSPRESPGPAPHRDDDPFDETVPGWAFDDAQATTPEDPAPSRRGPRWVVGLLVTLVVLMAVALLVDQLRNTPDASSNRTTASHTETPPTPARPTPTITPETTPTGAPTAGSVQAALAELAVKGRAPRTGYDREAFGQTWADVDRNGCDTRNDILRRDLDAVEIRPGTRGCVVERGILDDPFSGEQLTFERGYDTSILVQVDHVVSLSNAWQTGAQFWDASRREQFANDPLNLLAVDGPLNAQKSDGDAATWLPPDRTYWCEFVSRQVAVKAKYDLWVTPPERQAIQRVLTRCPEEPLATR